MPPTHTDRQRQALYRAEQAIAATLKQGGTIEHEGSRLTVEAERQFGDLAAIQTYVDRVLALGPVAGMERARVPVTVRERRGDRQAHYERETATIAIPGHRHTGWAMRETVVLHELAHHLDPQPSPAHGPSYAATLVRLYEDVMSPEAAHLLRVQLWEEGVLVAGGSGGTHRTGAGNAGASSTLDRISKVLAQAERASTTEEAATFFAKAQSLATRYSIDLAVARQHVARSQQRETPIHRRITIGQPRQAGNRHFVRLFLAIAHVNDVRCNVATSSTSVYPYGFPSDIDVVEALYSHLAGHMGESAADYLATGAFRESMVWSSTKATHVRATAREARLTFYDAYITAIGRRLVVAQESAERHAIRDLDAAGGTGASTTLVLADKRAEVGDYYASNSDARGSWSGWKGRTHAVASAAVAGRDAGERARLTGGRALPAGAAALDH
ncbi:TIGR04338 family metallohydrolase [Nocardioides sp.]|uniref:TIGR04338 family metallohydrolase n=1 Tax=Nocardioides sp. TaxID=35761 RepID=UPI003219C9D6